MKKKIISFLAAAMYAVTVIASAIMLSASPKLDVVANYALDSFKSLGEEIGGIGGGIELNGFAKPLYDVHSPDGTEVFSYGESVKLTIDIESFSAAGADDSRLAITSDNVRGVDTSSVSDRSAFGVFESVLRSNRHALEYHQDHDLFELHLGRGNTFRWAKDPRTNTRGMTFVLNPRPFIERRLEPEELEGWVLANVSIMYGPEKGRTVPRLLKNYSFAAQ